MFLRSCQYRLTFSLLNHPTRLFSCTYTPKKSSLPRSNKNKAPLIFQPCAGLRKKDGLPCTRRVPVNPSALQSTSTLAYCHSHRPTDAVAYATSISTQTRRTIQSSPIHDCWSLWIDKHIGPRKRHQLQQEMMKPVSPKDEAGYLYAYHLQTGPRVSTARYCYFKIGRSTNPTRRIGAVIQRCQYQPQLLDILPALASHDNTPNQMVKCPLSHRVERLIHIELSATWPSTGGFKCKGCGTVHREWFRVARPWRAGVRMSDQQVYTELIRPVMLHWIKYGIAASVSLQSTSSSSSSSPPL